LCNREIKFKEFLAYAQMLGSPLIATGHYARIKNHKDGFGLHKSVDLSKDQSYFLHELGQTALAATIFPLGEINKTEVRAEAVSLGLPNAKRKDSTGICFIGERKFSDFLAKYLPPTPGDIKDIEGNTIGEHQGLWFYTLGQRQGLDIGGAGDAWYVAEKNMNENTLIVVQGHDHPSLLKQSVSVKKMHWTLKAPAQTRLKCFAKTRYRQDDQSCEVEIFPDGGLSATFEALQRAPTPGQSLVLYDDTHVLGGGVIEQVL
jgi:tRNA-specific 2-thiouridylase